MMSLQALAAIPSYLTNISSTYWGKVLAVLKRSAVFIFAENALYLRLPSEKRDAIVHRICITRTS